jgi:hypothetical protein
MKHGHMSRNIAKAFFAFSTLGLAAACADNNTVAPAAETSAFVAPANFNFTGTVVSFRVDNSWGAIQKVGSHVISIPAGAICDIATSGYGATEWNKDCAPLRGSVVITATLLEGANGEPLVDFQPAMRFRPTKEVMLFMRENRNDGTKRPSVQYCNNSGFCTDESINDASLKPFRVGSTSILGRRLKHFSGYMVNFSEDCIGVATPLGDGSFFCDEGDGGGLGGLLGLNRRSGYMVASGEDITEIMKDDADDRTRGKTGR